MSKIPLNEKTICKESMAKCKNKKNFHVKSGTCPQFFYEIADSFAQDGFFCENVHCPVGIFFSLLLPKRPFHCFCFKIADFFVCLEKLFCALNGWFCGKHKGKD